VGKNRDVASCRAPSARGSRLVADEPARCARRMLVPTAVRTAR